MKIDKWAVLGAVVTAASFVCTIISGKKNDHDIKVAAKIAAENAVQEALKNVNVNITNNSN